jgi:beta-glucosidase-like glycosyl hydrolase
MPGPSRWRGEAAFLAAATDKLTPTALDDRTRAVMQLVKDCGSSGVPGVDENAQKGTRNTPETAAVLRRLAADSVVLLKNERDILPLKRDKKVSLQRTPSLFSFWPARSLTITTDSRHRPQRRVPIVLWRRIGSVEPILRGDASPSHQGQSISRTCEFHPRCTFIC